MQTTVDARGLSCPIPQQMTLDAIRAAKQGDTIAVLVDEPGARESVIRVAKALRLPYTLGKKSDHDEIHISKEELWTEKR